MRSWRDQEDDREILTNEHIKADLRKDAISALVGGVIVLLSMPLLILCLVQLLRCLTKWSFEFWVISIFAAMFALFGVWAVVAIIRRVVYLCTIGRDRFFVTVDKLVYKQEGRRSPSPRATLRFLLSPPKPNRYEFTSGTYEVAVETPHYCRSKKFAMNGPTLFRQSHCGDSFLLVSLKPGKPVMIYPLDLFNYRGSSPL